MFSSGVVVRSLAVRTVTVLSDWSWITAAGFWANLPVTTTSPTTFPALLSLDVEVWARAGTAARAHSRTPPPTETRSGLREIELYMGRPG